VVLCRLCVTIGWWAWLTSGRMFHVVGEALTFLVATFAMLPRLQSACCVPGLAVHVRDITRCNYCQRLRQFICANIGLVWLQGRIQPLGLGGAVRTR